MDGSGTLSREQLAAWRPFAAVLELLPPRIDSALQRCSGQSLAGLFVLGHLQQQPTRTASVSDLAACASSALPRMSRILARMETDGLVVRSACATDGRVVNVTLTDRGDEALREAMPHHDRIVREVLVDALSPEQLQQLGDIAGALAERLHPDAGAPVDRQRASVAG